MADKITLLTGGARSGKSDHAITLAGEASTGDDRAFFVATAEGLDDEMRTRIDHHRLTRPAHFQTIEEPLALGNAIRGLEGSADIVIVDCLTLWVSNLIGAERDDRSILAAADQLAVSLRDASFSTITVTDEVGGGIVPDHPVARRFRDLLGWTNQRIAAVSDRVIMMVVGCPIRIK
jgi:adenosylcobinamide kinase / adenosylcobinamide-phosphate guanylyltransferase